MLFRGLLVLSVLAATGCTHRECVSWSIQQVPQQVCTKYGNGYCESTSTQYVSQHVCVADACESGYVEVNGRCVSVRDSVQAPAPAAAKTSTRRLSSKDYFSSPSPPAGVQRTAAALLSERGVPLFTAQPNAYDDFLVKRTKARTNALAALRKAMDGDLSADAKADVYLSFVDAFGLTWVSAPADARSIAVPPDVAPIVSGILDRACNEGDEGHCTNFASLILAYAPVTKDYATAEQMFAKACIAGVTSACRGAYLAKQSAGAERVRLAAPVCFAGDASACFDVLELAQGTASEMQAAAEKLCQRGEAHACAWKAKR